ncbi:uncharacterized protein MYCFIDRAFT_49125 [Pseudocercospora fijiensis CIRAD86]|uniref:Ribosomal protein/NADH dehydrogenase domain-containing protein n=1 Tax=Pseudocercospora fijiensis (strain CIRAD86) TaxID=383855 RepID=N1QD09_PSEFD|nr:uncharacterized protein MYCFIDRAFT_49125 [Pseudocercospora fijiensis CIRAD86]EME89563.1 hypothetical protein MYCFIDRAFT_49125 [Pseudocercospora fijiensis CIRAD86]
MVSLSQRMRKLQTRLLEIRIGSGALILPKEVKRINMRFAPRMNQGHMGPKKFWRHELVRLKYHNPSVSMTVDRTALQEDPAVMSIHFSNSSPSSSEPPEERIETIDMKNYTSSEILDAVVRLTKAYPVEPTPKDLEEMRKLEEQRARSEKDSKLSQEVRARAKREKQLLGQARGEVASQEV